MRFLSPAMRTLLESRQGIESILVVGISWNKGVESLYSDRNLPGIAGKIIQLDTLDNVTRIDGNGQSTNLAITLDDADGTIKAIFDTVDIVYKPISIYQTFSALGTDDRVLLFEGAIASPIQWSEATRQISFTAINRKFNRQVGFALDESNLPIYHQSLLAQPWPMIFGTPVHVPCLQLTQVPSGITTQAFGWIDPRIGPGANFLKSPFNHTLFTGAVLANSKFDQSNPVETLAAISGSSFGGTLSPLAQQLQRQSIAYSGSLVAKTDFLNRLGTNQITYGSPYNQIIGGYSFPQRRPLLVKVGDRFFIATFLGKKGYVPRNPDDACPVHFRPYYFTYKYNGDVYYLTDTSFQFFQAGTKVELFGRIPGGYKYVASIVPGTVKHVYAYRSYNGIKRLTQVPKRYYSVIGEAVTPTMEVTYIVLDKPLSSISYIDNISPILYDQTPIADIVTRKENPPDVTKTGSFPRYGVISQADWEDDLYVTFESQVGPNAAEVLAYFILLYTDYEYDVYSFGLVYNYLANYPVNFALLDRPIVDQLIQDIAYQCRCAIWLKEGVYYIKYLSILPPASDTITDDDIEFGTLVVGTTSSDDLITKYVAQWQVDYTKPVNSIVIKHNVAKYGIIEQSYKYFCYNDFYLVQKSATFWAIRRSNTWKTVTCNVFLHKLGVETLDAVTLQLSQSFVSNAPIICQVDACQYSSTDDTITLTLWTGVLAGEMNQNILAFPAGISESVVFPLYNNIQAGGSPLKILPSIGATTPTQNSVGVNHNPIPAEDADGKYGLTYTDEERKRAAANGYVTPEQTQEDSSVSRPATEGAKKPSDIGDLPPLPYEPPVGELLPEAPPNFPEPDSTLPPSPGPIADLSTKPQTFIGNIISGGGDFWRMMLDNGSTVIATLTNPDPSYTEAELIGKSVTVVMEPKEVDGGFDLTYKFAYTESATVDLGIIVSGSGKVYTVTLYPYGFTGPPADDVTVTVPNLDDADAIEGGTKISGIVKKGPYYYYQPPVWTK